jgi:hypothetical protein
MVIHAGKSLKSKLPSGYSKVHTSTTSIILTINPAQVKRNAKWIITLKIPEHTPQLDFLPLRLERPSLSGTQIQSVMTKLVITYVGAD